MDEKTARRFALEMLVLWFNANRDPRTMKGAGSHIYGRMIMAPDEVDAERVYTEATMDNALGAVRGLLDLSTMLVLRAAFKPGLTMKELYAKGDEILRDLARKTSE